MRSIDKQSGFTIVEIMISMLLGLIMMVGVVSLVVGNKRSFQEQTESSLLQENGRFAVQLLNQDLRMTDFVGCSEDVTKLDNHIKGEAIDFYHNLDTPITGNDGGDINVSDQITVRFMSTRRIPPASK